MIDFTPNGALPPTIVTISCDGCCLPSNPGGYGGWGWVAVHKGKAVAWEKGCLGKEPGMTNNRAEYASIIKALEWLDKNSAEMQRKNITARILSDSQLAVNQINTKWACNSPTLRELRIEALVLFLNLETTLEWIPREQNEIADGLSREAVREYIAQEGESK